MTRTRYRSSTDANQQALIERFECWGWSVTSLHAVGQGVPDLLVAGTQRAHPFQRVTALVEVKTPTGKLRDTQRAFIAAWRGPVYVARAVEDVDDLVHARLTPSRPDTLAQVAAPVVPPLDAWPEQPITPDTLSIPVQLHLRMLCASRGLHGPITLLTPATSAHYSGVMLVAHHPDDRADISPDPCDYMIAWHTAFTAPHRQEMRSAHITCGTLGTTPSAPEVMALLRSLYRQGDAP